MSPPQAAQCRRGGFPERSCDVVLTEAVTLSKMFYFDGVMRRHISSGKRRSVR
jgi:hypothetical protein